MLDVYLIPKHGNASGRIFPHAGHFGVTPVVLQGNAITKLPKECDPLQVNSVTVRVKCTEYRNFKGDQEHVLWQKSKAILSPPQEEEYMRLGDWESPFRLTIPIDAALKARSAMIIKEYKVVWRIELIVDHKPIPYVGTSITKAFALNLLNHRTPTLPPISPPTVRTVGADNYATEVFLNAPHGAFGPSDTFTVALQARPIDAATVVKKATVVLERTIESIDRQISHDSFQEASSSSSSSPSTPSPPNRLSSLFQRSVSPRPPMQHTSSDSSMHQPAAEAKSQPTALTSVREKIAEVSSVDIIPSNGGNYWCAMSISLPGGKGKWDIGETQQSNLVSISYQLKATIAVKHAKRSQSKTLVCPPVPIIIAPVSAAQRADAIASAETSFSKEKKRHRSSRRGLYMHEGNIDITEPTLGAHRRRTGRSTSPVTHTSPIISTITGIATDVKPILLPPDHPGQSQSISFIFPSPPPHGSAPFNNTLPPIHSFGSSSSHLPTPPSTSAGLVGLDVESAGLWKQYQGTGRRISTTTSEEDEVQPSRSRQRVTAMGDSREGAFGRPSLPSLDALGLGLPHVPDDGRPRSRPRTAPIHSTFSMSRVPPPLSGALSVTSAANLSVRPVTSMARMGSTSSTTSTGDNDRFAFGVAGGSVEATTKQ
ncbi:hypothetical protein CI109_102442 [Kwoniella shandongensis]|uniref:Uncharacterized protein n=1 Tax=Kwoniella shandongensis TaxID=1734106 RepID=A0A5M6C178_9TREE|nr:uncharacterized protein CI109_003239 [Kwoniella shandongensis]KAA5528340.1 hypothetical protein CI109_003239 [Kwoniella shandongensis]